MRHIALGPPGPYFQRAKAAFLGLKAIGGVAAFGDVEILEEATKEAYQTSWAAVLAAKGFATHTSSPAVTVDGKV